MMSAAAAEQILVLPEVKQRSWATAAIVLIDVMALELALLLGCIVRYYLHSIFPIALRAPQYQGWRWAYLRCHWRITGWVCIPATAWAQFNGSAAASIRRSVYLSCCCLGITPFKIINGRAAFCLLTMFFALILAPALEAPLRKMLIARGICGVPMVILGGGVTGAMVVKTLKKESDLGFVPVGILDDNPAKWGTRDSWRASCRAAGRR